MRHAVRWAVVAGAVVGAGCVARGEAGEPPEAFGGNSHVALVCVESCGEEGCEESGEEWASAGSCERREFRFSFTEYDPELAEECRSYGQTRRSCGVSLDLAACEVFARTERAEMAEVYDCLADLACTAFHGTAPARCEPPGPVEHGVFRTVCDEMSARCPDRECSEDALGWAERSEGWMRPEVLDAVLVCLETESCVDLEACLEGWLEAVRPEGW